MGIKLVKGGAQRFDSVKNAIDAVDPAAELICVHDGVRPCVLDKWIDEVFEKAAASGAAILAAPLNATIKRVARDAITETVPREGLWEAQTPQVFRKDLLIKAYCNRAADFQPTDDAQLVEKLGHAVAVVAADRRNIKITTPGDMSLAQAILKDIARSAKSAGPLGAFQEAQW